MPTFINFVGDTFIFQPVDSAEIEVYILRIEAIDGGGLFSTKDLTVEVINTKPYYISDPLNQTVKLNSTHCISLPLSKDDDGHTIDQTYHCIPNITDFLIDYDVKSFRIRPNKWEHLREYKCQLTLSDGIDQKTYLFNIEVTNSAPIFIDGKQPQNRKIKFGETLKF